MRQPRRNISFVPCPIRAGHPVSALNSHPATSSKPNFYPQHASQLPTLQSLPGRTFKCPSPPADPKPVTNPAACSLLWFRIGHLRLADNPALTAASLIIHPVLPIVTLTRSDLSDAVLTAVDDLRSALLQLSSTLIVRVVDKTGLQSHVEELCEIADTVRPNRIFLNDVSSSNERSAIQLLKRRLTSVAIYDSLTYSRPYAPQSIPPPPQTAQNLVSDYLNIPNCPSYGEMNARGKLIKLLKAHPSCSKYELFFRLRQELYVGSVSKQRIILEWNEHRQLKSNGLKPIKRGRNPFSPNPSSSAFRPFFMGAHATPAIVALSISAYDVNGGDRRGVKWDEGTNSFVLQEWEHAETERRMNPKERAQEFMRRRRQFLTRAFFPEDVTPDYYSFTAWRFAQRCVSATIGVFGTSSLLVALGIRSGRIGQAAVISWVLKDGLGRVGKMIWAGSMGKDFDVDPKRWRFRSALLYALGNGLEIVTQIFPASFLVLATAANSMKQVSMLTSSATRNAMYRSFGERTQNIANITAKGEAQIVVADLIGMGCGIRLSKLVGSSRANVLGAYSLLTLLDVFGIYMELRQVVFRSLNAERSSIIINRVLKDGVFLSPSQVSPRESIFLKPKHQNWVRLSSIAKAGQSPEELDMLLRVFRRERFMVSTPGGKAIGPCRLVLRNDATNEDVLRAMLLVGHVQRELRNRSSQEALTMEETERLLRNARGLTKRSFPWFLGGLKEHGWNVDNLLFSTMKRRGYWRS